MPKKSASLASRTRQYSEFLKGVKLHIVALDHASSTIDRERYWECSERKNGMVRTIEASYEATAIEGTHFDVVGRLDMKILSTTDNSELLRIACQYSSHFHARTRVDGATCPPKFRAPARMLVIRAFKLTPS